MPNGFHGISVKYTHCQCVHSNSAQRISLGDHSSDLVYFLKLRTLSKNVTQAKLIKEIRRRKT